MQQRYDFDKIVDRRGTNAIKVDWLERLFGSPNLIPLWVADMDFETPAFITEALKKRLEHSLFGYTIAPPEYWRSIIHWLNDMHQWQIKKEWLTYIPGIVKGIGLAINVFTKVGDKVIIQSPVYHPFRIVPEANGREVVYNPLQWINGRYYMDFDQLKKIIDDRCKMFILSNPHNPAGIVWDKETLIQLADICIKNNILVISDEIHADMALYGAKHIPFATVSENAAQNSITFGAPSKTFNIAGIVSSYAIAPNDSIREKFYDWLKANELNQPTMFAAIATEVAYNQGRDWLKQMLAYLEKNIDFVDDYCKKHMPTVKVMKPQASFLIWLDCRELGLSHEKLINLFVKKAKLALNDGKTFGIEGEGFMRMNIGCPKSVLKIAMKQLNEAIKFS
ncbi:MAG: pyridoxal phosphate-dependent aminotransferase [Bacteroidales bacterium]|jgi:cystathionine beta-lyase|nr:pyridoxal phosphate-dependent aminotransferase [Bacteroidales bacterium]